MEVNRATIRKYRIYGYTKILDTLVPCYRTKVENNKVYTVVSKSCDDYCRNIKRELIGIQYQRYTHTYLHTIVSVDE